MPQDYFPPLPEGRLGDLPVTSGKFYNIEVYGTIYAEGGIISGDFDISGDLSITGDMNIGGDFYSSNWVSGGGSLPLSLPDSGASTGFALDGSAGTAQFQSMYAEGGTLGTLDISGNLTMDATGKLLTDDDASDRLEISNAGIKAYKADDTLLGTLFLSTADDSIDIDATTINVGAHFFSDTSVRLRPTASTSSGVFFQSLLSSYGGGYIRDTSTLVRRYVSGESSVIAVNEDYYSSMNVDLVSSLWYPDAASGTTLYSNLGVIRSSVGGHYTIEPGVDSYGAAPEVEVYINDDTYAEFTRIYGDAWFDAGSAGAPSISFGGDTDTGIYSSGANAMGFAAGGGLEFTLGDGYLQGRDSSQSVYIRSVTGSVSAPQYSFRSDGDTGMYWYGTDQVALTAGGAVQMVTGNATNPSIRLVDGTTSAPAMRFINDADTGIRLSATNQVAIVANSGDRLLVGATGISSDNQIIFSDVYTSTLGGSANVIVSSGGRIRRISSARKYKENIDFADWLADYTLRPVRYKRKDSPQYYYGFIADDVAAEDEILALYNGDGDVEDYDTRGVLAVLAAKVARLEEQMKGCTCHVV